MDTSGFLEDLYPDQLLYAVTIRSPVAKGYLKMIQFPKLPDNYSIITARNIPGENRLEDTSIPILSDGKISYIGEPVGLLLGQDKTKLEDLAARCKVIVDEEKPVFTYENDKGAPAASREIITGDTAEAFEKADKIIRGNYVTGIQEHWYAEPSGAVSWFENDENAKTSTKGKNKKHEKVLVVKTATQWPYHVKRSVARALGLDHSAVSVKTSALNLHMDGKLMFSSLIACHAALGTMITKKPVRLVLNRKEDFLYSPKRCKAHIDIASAIDEKGNISAAEIDIYVNLGAYGVNGDEILDQVCLGSLGFYNCGNIKLKARANKTNIPPQGPFSGFGLAQGFFAMERHISRVADEINQDPADWRKYRANTEEILPSGVIFKGAATEELINAAASASDYYRKWASYELLRKTRREQLLFLERGENLRGIGIAIGYQGNGLLYHGEDMGNYGVEVTLSEKNILEIKSGITSPNQDLKTIWADMASKILSIRPDMVRVITDNAPDCGPSCSSRSVTTITKLVEKCCLAIHKQRPHDTLPITVRRSVKPQSGSLLNGRFPPPDGKTIDISGFSKPGWAAAVVEVTIDMADYIPRIRGVWLVIDGGKIISEEKARRRLTCSVSQAVGWAFAEKIEYINGFLPESQFENFFIPSPADVPPIHVDFMKSVSAEPKGIGELPFTCIPAAFLQAISQAMDHSFNSLPVKRKEIWEAALMKKSEAIQRAE